MTPVTNLDNTLDLDLGLWCQFESENGVLYGAWKGFDNAEDGVAGLRFSTILEIKRPVVVGIEPFSL